MTSYRTPSQQNDKKYDNVACTCGKHYGSGGWTAQHRAKVYAWFRDRYPQGLDSDRREFLASYQREHGQQVSNLVR